MSLLSIAPKGRKGTVRGAKMLEVLAAKGRAAFQVSEGNREKMVAGISWSHQAGLKGKKTLQGDYRRQGGI